MKRKNSKKAKIQEAWAEISARAWTDKAFKKRLLANPKKILEEYGIDTEKNQILIVENTEDVTTLVLPKKPKGDLSDEELRAIAAAGVQGIIWKGSSS